MAFPVGFVGAGVLGLVTVDGCIVGFVLSIILYVLRGYPNMFLRNHIYEFALISKKVLGIFFAKTSLDCYATPIFCQIITARS